MNSDALGKMIDITSAIVIMMIIPIIWTIGMQEKLVMKYARICGSDFVEDVCHHGGISRNRYEVFLNGLAAPGKGFEVELECRSRVYEPLYENGIFTGDVSYHESVGYTGQILDRLYSLDECRFEAGSVFSLMIRRKDKKVYISGTITGSR